MFKKSVLDIWKISICCYLIIFSYVIILQTKSLFIKYICKLLHSKISFQVIENIILKLCFWEKVLGIDYQFFMFLISIRIIIIIVIIVIIIIIIIIIDSKLIVRGC